MSRRLLKLSLVLAGFAVLFQPAEALAQRRGSSRGAARGRQHVVVAPQRGVAVLPQRTIIYPPGYGPWSYPYGYGYPYPYQYPPRFYSDTADLRIQATPRETEVYVDGARAGIVDDFDGFFQRLHLSPGDHEITLYLAGYRTWSDVRYFGPRADQKILHTMLPLAPGQPDEPRPVRVRPPYERNPDDMGSGDAPAGRQPRSAPPRDLPRGTPRAEPRETPPTVEPPVIDPRSFGTLSVGIRPSDAEITLDGQKQTLSSARFVIQLTEGVHHLVIKKNGFDTFETDLQIRRGRTLSFDVNLVK